MGEEYKMKDAGLLCPAAMTKESEVSTASDGTPITFPLPDLILVSLENMDLTPRLTPWVQDRILSDFETKGLFRSKATKASPRQSKSFRTRGSNSSTRKRVSYEDSSNIPSHKINLPFPKITIPIKCTEEFQHTCKFILQDMLSMPCLKSLSFADKVTHLSISDLPELQFCLLTEERPVPATKRRTEVHCDAHTPTEWESLPLDLQHGIFKRVDFKDLFRCKALSKPCKERIESNAFCQLRGAASEGSFTAISYYIKDDAWRCSGYDMESITWRSLPPISYLPPPDADLFKEYSVSGHRSLMCASIAGTSPKEGEIVVFNPLTGRKRVLPPLLNPRTPVLVHISVDSGGKSYTVVVAGSSSASDEHLSKKVEVFRSTTSKWTKAGEIPGPVFGLNEHQAGVCINGILYCIAFLKGSGHRGVVALDVKNGKWIENLICPIPFSLYSKILQLVECNGKLHLFSEQERGASVEHCIDVLVSAALATGECASEWTNVLRVKKCGRHGFEVYPQHICVRFGEEKLCVLNTLRRDGVVYDMRDGKQVAVLPPPPANQRGEHFFTLNPASFTLQPSFGSDTHPEFLSYADSLIL